MADVQILAFTVPSAVGVPAGLRPQSASPAIGTLICQAEHAPSRLACQAALVAVAALAGASKVRGRGRSRALRIARRVEVGRSTLLGSGTDAFSESSGEVAAVQLVQGRMPNGVVQFRSVYSADVPRYGEEFDRRQGSTDNVYLLKPEHAPWVMIGALEGQDITDELFKQLNRAGANRDTASRLGHLVLQYFDGKQVPFIEAVILRRPSKSLPLLVYGSMPIVIALKKNLSQQALGRCRLVPIKNSTTLEIEEGRVMKFVLTPTEKLPEALNAFDPQTGTLFSGKFFSAHRAIPNTARPFDMRGLAGWEQYADDWFHFFDVYFFTKTAQAGIRKIFMLAEALHGPDVEEVAPLHGPVIREQAWKLMAKYEAWTEQKVREEDRRDREVLVMYASAYGHTKTLARAIAKGLRTSGARVNELNLEHCAAADVAKALEACDGFVVGSPTLGGEMPTQVKEALGVVLGSSAASKLPCGVFGSFGWSGEAVDELQFRLKDSGFPMAFDPIRVKFRPTDEAIQQCEAAGVRMTQKIRQISINKKKSRARNVTNTRVASVANQAREAFSKMRTSQCILSAVSVDGKEVLAPVCWVNQASFQPPGVTLSIPTKLLGSILTSSMEQALLALYKRYDTDGDGTVDRGETLGLVRDLFDISSEEGTVISPKLQEEIDVAMNALDADGHGTLTFEELMAAAEGSLKDLIDRHRSAASVDAAVREGRFHFALNMVPEGKDPSEFVQKPEPHKKAKPQHGCFVHKDASAFVECSAQQAMRAGEHTILYAHVTGGKVFEERLRTDMVASLAAELRVTAMGAAGRRQAHPPDAAFVGASATQPLARAGRTGRFGREGCAGRTARRARGGELSEVATWTGLTPGKKYRLQTLVVDAVADGTSTIRSLDWDRDRFDIEFALERGTTYNSYIIKGADKTALIDTSHEKFADLYLDALQQQADLATLDYLVVSHTEPDHSGLIAQVLERAAELGNEALTVVGSKICLQFLQNLVFRDFKSQIVAGGDKIDLGGGHELEFVIAPNLHWPDTMFTFDHATGLLYTCDAFGMHYCSENLHDAEGVKELLPHYALYYDCLMRPNARSVVTALQKTAKFEISKIATGHGPMLTESTTEWVEQYRSWSNKALEKQGPSVALFWVSGFGSSERLAQAFAHGLTSSSVNVEMHDLNAVDAFEITECLARSSVLAICTPPAESAAASALSSIMAGVSPKHHKFVALDSCGEGQLPVALMVNKLAELGIEAAIQPMTVEDRVSLQVVQGFEEAGLSLARDLTQKDKAKAAKKTDKDLSKALGRLGSTLYIVTAMKSDFRHAMVASWVTPASEEPLGISLAIAKTRAMEPFLRIGDTFAVNVLEEGNPATRNLMKHFLQRFPPGADRLEGVDSFVENGAIVLRGACAYFECKIISRMDASDHWVSFAEVIGGSVAKPEASAAVHHRKVGTYY